ERRGAGSSAVAMATGRSRAAASRISAGVGTWSGWSTPRPYILTGAPLSHDDDGPFPAAQRELAAHRCALPFPVGAECERPLDASDRGRPVAEVEGDGDRIPPPPGEDAGRRRQEAHAALAELGGGGAQPDGVAAEVEHRAAVVPLRGDVDPRLRAEREPGLDPGGGEARTRPGAPAHRGARPVA